MKRKRIMDLLRKYDDERYLTEKMYELQECTTFVGGEEARSF